MEATDLLAEPSLVGELECQREAGFLRDACKGHGDNSARPFVEHILAKDHNRTKPGLFVTANGVQVCEENVAPQYSGHSAMSPASPSSAIFRSKAGSSFEVSRARRARSSTSRM